MSTGRVHSIQSLGTLDGPGVRFVVFMQGCHLRCRCCHNPDTWSLSGGVEYTPAQIVEKAARYREYFGQEGGITLSGGEPLLQPAFACEVFSLCRERGIHTCLDTSGSLLNEEVRTLLTVTDRVLLDLKYTDDTQYRQYVGCGLSPVLSFLDYLEEKQIPVTLRQVIIPTLNDTVDSIKSLKATADKYTCVDKIELLPFRKLCHTKYESLGFAFPFAHLPEPTGESMTALRSCLDKYT